MVVDTFPSSPNWTVIEGGDVIMMVSSWLESYAFVGIEEGRVRCASDAKLFVAEGGPGGELEREGGREGDFVNTGCPWSFVVSVPFRSGAVKVVCCGERLADCPGGLSLKDGSDIPGLMERRLSRREGAERPSEKLLLSRGKAALSGPSESCRARICKGRTPSS